MPTENTDRGNQGFVDRPGVLAPPPLVPVIAVLAGIGFDWLAHIPNGWMPPAPLRYWIGGVIAVGVVAAVGAGAVRTMRNAGESPDPWSPVSRIVEQGAYRYSRNPMYLGMVILCLAMSILLANVWILVLAPVCALILWWIAIRPEEAYLEAKFGDTYRDYKRRVRRWL